MTDRSERPARVLVVDDNEDAATALARFLSAAGWDVRACFSGWEALEEAVRFSPDACVLDINMPDMDGYELARLLRAGGAEPVLATMTAYGDEAHLDRAAHAGFDLHFQKPADPTELVNQLRSSLQR
jgi:DNA-binding response OmpR family regulator